MSTGVTGRNLWLAAGVLLASTLAATALAAPPRSAASRNAASRSAASRSGGHFTVAVGGGLVIGASDWSSKASWDSWAETASVESRYEAPSGTAFQGALGYRFSKHLGVVLAGGWASRDAKASLTATVPHPLYLESPRTVTGEASGLSCKELAFHLDLEWRTVTGPFEIAAFAGPTLARVEATAVSQVSVVEVYPFDEATYQSATTSVATSDFGLGLNVGASATWLATSHLDLGLEARYVRASVDLAPAGLAGFSLDAGGLQVAARLRLRF